MVAIKKYSIDRNLPRITFRLDEGVATLSDIYDASGMKVEGGMSWNAEIKKNDLVKLVTTTVTPTVAKAVGASKNIIGKVVDSPVNGKMTPITGASGANVTPSADQRRYATVALYGQSVDTFKSDGVGVISAGDLVGHSTTTPNYVAIGTPLVTTCSKWIALAYVAASADIQLPVLLGYFGYVPSAA